MRDHRVGYHNSSHEACSSVHTAAHTHGILYTGIIYFLFTTWYLVLKASVHIVLLLKPQASAVLSTPLLFRELFCHAQQHDIAGTCLQELRTRGISTFDYILIDHEKTVYLKDLLILQSNGFLKTGSVIVADNVLLPGVPDYRKYVAKSPDFHTVEHVTDMAAMDYLCDIVAVSEFCGPASQ